MSNAEAILSPTEALWLPSAARTTQQQSGDFSNPGYSRLLVWLDVTAASGVGGLTLHVDGKNPGMGLGITPAPLSGPNSSYQNFLLAAAAVNAVNTRVYAIGPGLDGGNNDLVVASHLPLPATWRLRVTVADGSSYTYSVAYSLIP